MSHLGERITALVDGELGHDERDRVLAHLAGCDQCRAEAEAHRRLKRRLGSLGDAPPSPDLLTRLYAMGEPGGPIPPRARPMPGTTRPPVLPRPSARYPQDRPKDNRPARSRRESRDGRARRLPRVRYLAVGAATLAVLGVGAAGFAAGSDQDKLPRVAPSLQQYAVEHALTSGDVPVTDKDPAGEPAQSPP